MCDYREIIEVGMYELQLEIQKVARIWRLGQDFIFEDVDNWSCLFFIECNPRKYTKVFGLFCGEGIKKIIVPSDYTDLEFNKDILKILEKLDCVLDEETDKEMAKKRA